MELFKVMSEEILEVVDLSKVYKGQGYEVNALKKVSFKLCKGEFVAIMGTSGSGKSTVLNILGALDSPTSGSVELNGKIQKDFFKEPFASLYRRKNIGFIFQSFNLLKDLTVEENVSTPLILEQTDRKIIKERVDEVLELVGLTQWRHHRPIQLSGGQQQRVAIARAIISRPPIILADEPTGNLDYNTSKEVLNTLIEMKENYNQSILLVTHDPNVASYADRILFFHDGEIVEEYSCQGKNDLESILAISKSITEKDG